MSPPEISFPFITDFSLPPDDLPHLGDRLQKITVRQPDVTVITRDKIDRVLERMLELGVDEEVIGQSNDLWPSSRLEDLEALAGHIVTPLKNMDFLRIDQKGYIIMDVFYPGFHFTTYASVSSEHVQEIQIFLSANSLKWTDIGTGWEKIHGEPSDEADSDGLCVVTRAARISDTLTLVWTSRRGMHDGKTHINDALKIESREHTQTYEHQRRADAAPESE